MRSAYKVNFFRAVVNGITAKCLQHGHHNLFKHANGIGIDSVCGVVLETFCTSIELGTLPPDSEDAYVAYNFLIETDERQPGALISKYEATHTIPSVHHVLKTLGRLKGFNDGLPNIFVVRADSGAVVLVSASGIEKWKIEQYTMKSHHNFPVGGRVFFLADGLLEE